MSTRPKSDELRHVFSDTRGYFLAAGLFALAINLLYLAGPIYMLQVYDRVLSSGSVATLVMLTLALLLGFGTLAALDFIRARVMTRASIRLDRLLAGRVVGATLERTSGPLARSQPLRDFDTFRQFVTGTGIHAILDLPWAPIYIGVIFLLHPALGAFALGSAVVLIVLALVNEWLVREPLSESNAAATQNYSFTEMSLRNADVVKAMGMLDGLLTRWGHDRFRVLDRQTEASDRAAALSSLIKFMRLAMQSLILGLGAYLVLSRLTTPGSMFAASILLGRALQPVEQTVGQWRALVAARGAWMRVRELLLASPPAPRQTELPAPSGDLAVENLLYIPQGSPKPVLRQINFLLQAGESLGVVGPSGAGKSTLARHLVGVLRPSAGAIRLDGADMVAWLDGNHVGYLPQDIELFSDTIAANIGRFRTDSDGDVVAAAKMAGVHEMILRLPLGYDTNVGEGGEILSGGFRQRIGLARAVFGHPKFILLDEPSSNLDTEGDQALAACLAALKQRGVTTVIISHRAASLASVDKILVLRDGTQEVFSDKAEFMRRLNRPVAASLPKEEQRPQPVASGAA